MRRAAHLLRACVANVLSAIGSVFILLGSVIVYVASWVQE